MEKQLNQPGTPRGQIEKRLQEAIEKLHADVTRVELWAYALSGFAQPVPDYQPDDKFTLKRPEKTAAKSGRFGAARGLGKRSV